MATKKKKTLSYGHKQRISEGLRRRNIWKAKEALYKKLLKVRTKADANSILGDLMDLEIGPPDEVTESLSLDLNEDEYEGTHNVTLSYIKKFAKDYLDAGGP
jgi:hypothetical protein